MEVVNKRVGIVGAGISGLLACKYALSKGFTPVVFESRSCIGGVWTKTIETTKLQTPGAAYQFSDFPWPADVQEEFPNQYQVFDYLKAYANHFDLVRHIRFSTKVVSLSYQGPSGPDDNGDAEMEAWTHWGGSCRGIWNIITVTTEQEQEQEEVHRFDFVILCVGRFSDVPNIPEFPPTDMGPEAFQGKVIHSMDYSEMGTASAADLVKGKRVAVVGFQKSAMDIAMECSTINGVEHPCTVLYRTEHWNVPDYLPWGIPMAYLYLNRFSELLVHKPRQGFLLSLLATLLSPLRWGISKFVETHIKRKLRLDKYGMVPKHSFLKELSSCLIATVPDGFYDRVDKGSIQLKKLGQNNSFGFCEQGILVDDGDPLEVDLVILCTGFRGVDKLKHIFSSPTFQDYIVGSHNAAVPLYRECIHPQIPQLAVIGFSESVSNLYTSEMRCKWVAELLNGTFKLPSIKEMEKDIEAWDKYMKQYSGEYYRRSCIGALHIWYNDQLCKDMGWNPHRKKGFFADLFQPYGPLDYAQP
ncbi:hypothetical protein ACH5RR_021845 [Cinchona calisaya]|uniref:Flavin-containing monooxygenase n=1 Tax=Cinchona calisaya TaxID=153742 RepID=A0ABD2Z751_9GENT